MNAVDLFKRSEAVLEYRPVRHGDVVKWYWALLPLPLEDSAIEVGLANTKGEASLQARQAARQAARRITKVRTHHPSLTQPEQPGPEPPEPMPL